MWNNDIESLKFDANGLIPAIAQDAHTGAVLMMAYMSRESLELTLKTGYATYYSRKRQELWRKGETSGNYQRICDILYDCDGDTLLLKVMQNGVACHTGRYTCFNDSLTVDDAKTSGDLKSSGHCEKPEPAQRPVGSEIVQKLYEVIIDRSKTPVEGSYTNYLLAKGVEKICKKVGEESSEVIIAAMKNSPEELKYEAADLIYHLLVLLAERGLTPRDVWTELENRRK